MNEDIENHILFRSFDLYKRMLICYRKCKLINRSNFKRTKAFRVMSNFLKKKYLYFLSFYCFETRLDKIIRLFLFPFQSVLLVIVGHIQLNQCSSIQQRHESNSREASEIHSELYTSPIHRIKSKLIYFIQVYCYY